MIEYFWDFLEAAHDLLYSKQQFLGSEWWAQKRERTLKEPTNCMAGEPDKNKKA